MSRLFLFAVVLAGYCGISQASTMTLGPAIGYNVFTFSNFSGYGTDSEGRMAIGGNFAPTNGQFSIASSYHGNDYALVVGGNFTNTYNSIGGGNVYVAGDMNWTVPTLPGNTYVGGNFTNNGWGGSTAGVISHVGSFSSPHTTLSNQTVAAGSTPIPIDFLSAKTTLDSVSSTLAGSTQTGSVTKNGASSPTYTLTGANTSVNVFNLTDTRYNSATINISAPAGSTVIVNVAGSSVSFSGGSINLSGVSAANVIFNFEAATSLAIGSIAFNGTILAPDAAFVGTWGQLNGQIIANTIAGTTEFHNVLFQGNLGNTSFGDVSAAPEPSTWLMLLAGSVLLMAPGRKQLARLAIASRNKRK